MQRKKPRREQYLDRGLKGWIITTAHRHAWRIPYWMDDDDLIQEAFICFTICKTRYAHRIEKRSHFMGLFKRIFLNRIHDLANQRSRIEESGFGEIAASQIMPPDGSVEATLEWHGGIAEDQGELVSTLHNAPEEIRHLLAAIDTGELNQPYKKGGRNPKTGRFIKYRETTSEYLNRILKTKGVDYERELRTLLAYPV